MRIPLYQVDAFAEKAFEGNPAAVCPLNQWLDDSLLQKIAAENNLSETAFFVSTGDDFQLRWFTPVEEVDLCGHATLASAHVLFKHLGYQSHSINFLTKSGKLTVEKTDNGYQMNFPATMPAQISTDIPTDLIAVFGATKPVSVMAAFDYILVLNNEQEVRDFVPDLVRWQNIDLRGVVITAPGNDVDFVSRCFFPKLDVNEDPVTGSAQCELAPYWASMLDKNTLIGQQISARSGRIHCQLVADRVLLSGTAIDYMMGEIHL